ncbi:MAG: hypothetical protein ACD_75C00523G0001, partial [uncultured bacterium]
MAIVSNYARISFNFGPTLLLWMENMLPRPTRQSWRPTGRASPGAPVMG